MAITGGCLCGQVRLAIAAEPEAARLCWCRDCQRIASGSATVNVLFAPEAITYSGEIALFEKVADSGNVVERGFCPRCGSQIFSRPKGGGSATRIRAGVLDEPVMAPQAIIWTDSAPAWVKLDPALPQFAKGPPAPPPVPPKA